MEDPPAVKDCGGYLGSYKPALTSETPTQEVNLVIEGSDSLCFCNLQEPEVSLSSESNWSL